MVPPSPKRPRLLPRDSFEIPHYPQAVFSRPETPMGESARDSVWPTPDPESPQPAELEASQPSPQAQAIVGPTSRPDSVTTQSAYDIFTDEQCEKILWLALHGVPSPIVARVVYRDIPKPKYDRRWQHVVDIDKKLQRLIVELATGRDKTQAADELVEHLLQQGDRLNWSPYLLQQAAGFMNTPGDEATQTQVSRNCATERIALSKWRSAHGDENAVPPSTGKSKKENLAFRGYIREGMEREVMEQLGYRGDSHEAERALMKKRLLEIRELGKLPARLMEVGIAALTP
ncbi:hypothetical protein AYL99_07349 [Fonsecaea erecta]|uniref:Uncharacterized protein n=1 Tax=Fonsecaea erecta TaxID=1367422 RepID=A0A178ZEP6_9EURO|nr:hypothetical protein AYL99_07349 [Fonsecaea erecta]OAP58259.1 hypothetical protein AYL99_07349 [Fonsecaea erecta]